MRSSIAGEGGEDEGEIEVEEEEELEDGKEDGTPFVVKGRPLPLRMFLSLLGVLVNEEGIGAAEVIDDEADCDDEDGDALLGMFVVEDEGDAVDGVGGVEEMEGIEAELAEVCLPLLLLLALLLSCCCNNFCCCLTRSSFSLARAAAVAGSVEV